MFAWANKRYSSILCNGIVHDVDAHILCPSIQTCVVTLHEAILTSSRQFSPIRITHMVLMAICYLPSFGWFWSMSMRMHQNKSAYRLNRWTGSCCIIMECIVCAHQNHNWSYSNIKSELNYDTHTYDEFMIKIQWLVNLSMMFIYRWRSRNPLRNTFFAINSRNNYMLHHDQYE